MGRVHRHGASPLSPKPYAQHPPPAGSEASHGGQVRQVALGGDEVSLKFSPGDARGLLDAHLGVRGLLLGAAGQGDAIPLPC